MKKRRKKASVLTEEHHRRCRSLGGLGRPWNISYLEGFIHTSWHVLVGNMNAYQIAEFFNQSSCKPNNVKVVCCFINGSPVKKRGRNNSRNEENISRAWKTIFDGLSFKEVLDYVNNILIDPSYHLYMESIQYFNRLLNGPIILLQILKKKSFEPLT